MFVLALSFPARADFDADVQAPMELLTAEKYDEALAALEKLAPDYEDDYRLQYLIGLTWIGKVGAATTRDEGVDYLRRARRKFLLAKKLGGAQEMTEVEKVLKVAEDALGKLKAPLDAPAKAQPAPVPVKPNAPAAPPTAPNIKLAPRPGTIIGRCVDMRGKPLAGGVGIRVFGTPKDGGEKTSFETKTDATGMYAVKLPAGNFRLGWAHYFTDAPAGPSYALPLHPLDGSNDDQDSAPGIVENCVLKINGRVSPKNDADSDLSYYGGNITVEGGPLENGNFLDGYNYKFPDGSSVEFTLAPQGKLADGSTGQTLVLRRPIARGYIGEFMDVPIGAYEVTARLIDADGKATPLRIAAAKPFTGTSPTYRGVEPADFGAKANIYFPSRGDSVPLLTYGGAAKAPLYVKP